MSAGNRGLMHSNQVLLLSGRGMPYKESLTDTHAIMSEVGITKITVEARHGRAASKAPTTED